MTYARARLWVGISYVGTLVLICALSLLFHLPEQIFPSQKMALGREAMAWLGFVALYILISVPFDLVGGYVLPRKFSRASFSFFTYSRKWLRGVTVHGLILFLLGITLLQLGKWLGPTGALAGAFSFLLILIAFQKSIAQCVGGLTLSSTSSDLSKGSGAGTPALLLDNEDRGSSGGIVGVPGRERILLPSSWKEDLTSEQWKVEVLRREAAINSGSRSRGLLIACAWNLMGLFLATVLTGARLSTVSDIVTISCAFTIWSFLGLLLLPTISRAAVKQLDREAIKAGASVEEVIATASTIDQLQEDEPGRSKLLELVFHPVPSVEHRAIALNGSAPSSFDAWNVARMTLYLSWVGSGLLSRAVHCNAGRPELWVLLPTD